MANTNRPPLSDATSKNGAERRRATRHEANTEESPVCTVLSPRGAGGLVRVRDLSSYGIGLICSKRVEPGTVLTMEVNAPDGSLSRVFEACVIHAETVGKKESAVGCAFGDVLPESEVLRLLGRGRRRPTRTTTPKKPKKRAD